MKELKTFLLIVNLVKPTEQWGVDPSVSAEEVALLLVPNFYALRSTTSFRNQILQTKLHSFRRLGRVPKVIK